VHQSVEFLAESRVEEASEHPISEAVASARVQEPGDRRRVANLGAFYPENAERIVAPVGPSTACSKRFLLLP
jgi:hypothetical protein